MMPRRLNKEKGIILPLVLILTLVLMITGLVFVSLGMQENRLVQREIKKRQAFYLAEAGIETAIWQFNCRDQPWLPWPAPWTEDSNGDPAWTETLNDSQGSSVGDYEVTVTDKDAFNPIIKSTGYVPSKEAEGKVEKTVNVILEKDHDPMFGYAIASEGGIIIENPGTGIIGNIYAIGDITINDMATVDGNAEATGIVTNQEAVTGTTTEGADELPFPEFDSDYYQYKASSIEIGNLEINEDASVNGILYVTGNVTISNSTLVGPGSIVAEGTINVQDYSNVGTSEETGVSLISAYEGEDIAIKIEKGAEERGPSIVWGALWAPNGEIRIEEHSKLFGSAVSGGQHKIETGTSVIDYRKFEEDFYSYVARPMYSVQDWQEE